MIPMKTTGWSLMCITICLVCFAMSAVMLKANRLIRRSSAPQNVT